MNLMSKQAIRKPVFTIFMVLLLGLAMALSCIGYSALTSARLQSDLISTTYTTVAIPQQPDLDNLSAEDIGLTLQKRVYADWAAQEAPQLKMIDRRCLLTAHIPESISLSSSSADPSEYNAAFDDECYSLAIFALRCEEINEQSAEETLLYDAAFSVEETVSLSQAYDCFPSPDRIHIYGDIRQEDGSVPFQTGKTYLVFGLYHDYPITKGAGAQHGGHEHNSADYNQITSGYRYLIPFPEIQSNAYGDPSSLADGMRNGKNYRYPTSGQLPWVSEYTGSVQEYINSASGKLWIENILPICQLNQESATVILTDKVTSLYSFNTGDTTLLSGRFFTDEEYQQGDAVCIVSAAYAQINGLELGDTLKLDYYDSGFGEFNNGAVVNSVLGAEDPGPYRQRHLSMPEDSIGVGKEYTIVGIYTGARFAFGTYHFNADTILVPKSSVPNAQEYEMPANSLLNTFVLQNGSVEEFEAYMDGQGLANQFLYFDQEFTEAKGALDALEANAVRLFYLGAGVFLLVGALFLFLNFRRMGPVIRSARLLGRSAKHIGMEIFVVLLMQIGCSTALGAALAAILYDGVTQSVISNALALQPIALAKTALLLFAILLLTGSCWTALAASRNLMRRK